SVQAILRLLKVPCYCRRLPRLRQKHGLPTADVSTLLARSCEKHPGQERTLLFYAGDFLSSNPKTPYRYAPCRHSKNKKSGYVRDSDQRFVLHVCCRLAPEHRALSCRYS